MAGHLVMVFLASLDKIFKQKLASLRLKMGGNIENPETWGFTGLEKPTASESKQ